MEAPDRVIKRFVIMRRLSEMASLAAILGTALFIYRGALYGFFEQDDFGWLYETRFRNIWEYLHSFFRFNNARSYRPLSQETFFLVFQKVFGLWPPAYHTMSIACHVTAALILYRLLRKFASTGPALVGTLFFAVHPAHFRSVFWISAIPEPMALMFYLLSLLCFVRFDRDKDRRFYLGSILAMGLGMLSKESILSLPAVLAAYCLIYSRKRLLWTAPHFLYAALYAVLRALSHASVDTAPYQLTFGSAALQNLAAYLSWTSYFSEALVKVKLHWNVPAAYPWIASGFFAVMLLLVMLSRNTRTAVFSMLWFAMALQPVLYFHEHIFAYYLAPAIPAVSLLLASALDGPGRKLRPRFCLLAPVIVCFSVWSSYSSTKREGQWWNERSYIARDILAAAPDMTRQVPDGHTAFLFGFGEEEFGAMQNDAAFKAYGISPYRHIFFGLDKRYWGQIEHLRKYEGLSNCHCFVYSGGKFVNWTEAFRRNPKPFMMILPFVELNHIPPAAVLPVPSLEVSSNELRAGTGSLTIRVRNLSSQSIDVLYTLDRQLMPAIIDWQLGDSGTSTIFVDSSTLAGDYHYLAFRSSNDPDSQHWFPTDIHVRVR